ncbi:sulfate transporter family-domain-containing protein [Zopfochytrium polystomum]|nr:sulfate transporter family-domain-containing protein [Zopfochytrium polystomum]
MSANAGETRPLLFGMQSTSAASTAPGATPTSSSLVGPTSPTTPPPPADDYDEFNSNDEDADGPNLRHPSSYTAAGSSTDRSAVPAARKRTMTQVFWTRLRYYVPILSWLPTYSISKNLEGDVVAGMTVACLLIPQALSYAQALVKIPPVYGLYTCFVPLIVYSILGTSRQLGVGPEALVSILVGAAISEKSGMKAFADDGDSPVDNVMENIAIANFLGLLVGVFTLLLGFFRLGFLDSVLSRALLRGFVTAVAVVVMIDLSPNLLGIKETFNAAAVAKLSSPERRILAEENLSPVEKFLLLLEQIGDTHILTAIISGVSILFLVLMKALKGHFKQVKVLQLIPEILALVVVSTCLCAFLRWDEYGVDILRDVKGGLIAPKFPSVTTAKVRFYLLSAVLISVIGFVESIAVAKTYATKYNYSMSPNRELVAIGTANVLGSICGGWPAFGSLGRSAVNDASGAKTQVAGLITGIIILVTIIALLPLFYFLPKAVCSAIIVVAATKLIEIHDFLFIFRLGAWSDLGLLLLTFLSTLFISIEVGTLISVGTSLLLVVQHTTKTRIAILGKTLVVDPKTGQVKVKFRSITEKGEIERIEGSLVIRIEEGLFFGNSGQLKERLNRVEMHGELGVHPGEAPRRRTGARRAPLMDGASGGVLGDSHSNSLASMHGAELQAVTTGDDTTIKSVIFDIGAVTAVDATATQTLLEIVESYKHRGIIVCFVKLRDSCKPWFVRSGLYTLVGPDRFFSKIREALESVDGGSSVDDYGTLGNRGHPSGGYIESRDGFGDGNRRDDGTSDVERGSSGEFLRVGKALRKKAAPLFVNVWRNGGDEEGNGANSESSSPDRGGAASRPAGLTVPPRKTSKRSRARNRRQGNEEVMNLFSDSEIDEEYMARSDDDRV